jgi:hypothetical protein
MFPSLRRLVVVVIRVLLASVFLWACLTKLMDARTIIATSSVLFGITHYASWQLVHLLVLSEFVLAVFLLFASRQRWPLVLALLFLALASIALLRLYALNVRIGCGCLQVRHGAADRADYLWALGRNGVLILGVITAAFFQPNASWLLSERDVAAAS